MVVSPLSQMSGPLVCCSQSWQLKAEFPIQVKAPPDRINPHNNFSFLFKLKKNRVVWFKIIQYLINILCCETELTKTSWYLSTHPMGKSHKLHHIRCFSIPTIAAHLQIFSFSCYIWLDQLLSLISALLTDQDVSAAIPAWTSFPPLQAGKVLDQSHTTKGFLSKNLTYCFSWQVWLTEKCLTKWSVATGCLVQQSAQAPCMSSCFPAGGRIQKRGLHLSTCRAS